MNQEKYFTDDFLVAFSGSRSIDSSTYRRAHPALQAVEGVVARQAIGQFDQTADRWLRRRGKQSDIRRPTPHRKAGGKGSSAAARIFDFVPARTKWLPGSPSGRSGRQPGNFSDAGHSTKAGALVQLKFKCDGSVFT